MNKKLSGILRSPVTARGLIMASALAGMAVYAAFLLAGSAWPEKRLLFQPGANYFLWHDYHTVFNPRSSFWLALPVLGYIFSAAAIGYKLCFSGVLTKEQAGKYWFLLFPLAFIPGYFISAAINRLVTLALVNSYAQVVIAVFYTGAFLWGAAAVYRRAEKRHLAGAALAALLYAVFLVDGLQKGGSHIVGDGGAFFLDLISGGEIFGGLRRFPLFSQHYDEIMFLYPLYPVLKSEYMNIYLPFLMLYAFGKAAALLAAAQGLRWLSGSLGFGVLLAVYGFFGGLFLIPASSFLVLESGVPIGDVLHISRVFGILIPFLLAVCISSRRLFEPPAGARWYFGLFLVGIGLSASSVSNFYAVLAVSFSYLLLRAKASTWPVFHDGRLAGKLIAPAILLAAALPFMIAGPLSIIRLAGGWALFLCILAFTASMFSAPVNPPVDRAQLRLVGKTALVLAAGYAAGIVFLGNIYLPRTLGPLGGFEMLSRGVANPMAGPILKIFGPNSFCDLFPLQHCASARNYVERFGLLYTALILGAALFGKRLVSSARGVEVEDLRVMMTAVFVLTGVFLYEYTNGLLVNGQQYWLIWFKSRLLEPWFYMGILIPFACAYSVSGSKVRKLLAALIAGTMLIDLAYNYSGRLPQFLVNLQTAGKVIFFF